VFFGAAVLGAILTLVMGRDPGALLGSLILIGAVIAALGIHREHAYLIIPMPAVTYLVLAVVTGGIHDTSTETSTAALGLSFLQWIGSGFFSIFGATLLVLLIFGGRLLASRQLVSGSFTMSSHRAANRAASGRPGRALMTGRPAPARRESRAPWDDPDPWYDRDSRDDRDARGSQDPRDDRGDRDTRRDRQSDGRGRQPRSLPSDRSLPPNRGDRPGWDDGPGRDAPQTPRQPRPRGPRPGTSGDWDDRGSRNRR
jgi:hypothetical protein